MKVHEYYSNVEYFYIVTDYYNGKSLLSNVKRQKIFNEIKVQRIMK